MRPSCPGTVDEDSSPALPPSSILPSFPLPSVPHPSPPFSFLSPAAHFTVSCFFLELRKRLWHSLAAVLQWVKPPTDVDEVPLSSRPLGPSSSPILGPLVPENLLLLELGATPHTLTASGACIRTQTPTPTSLPYTLYPSLPLFSKFVTATYLISSLTKIPKWTSENICCLDPSFSFRLEPVRAVVSPWALHNTLIFIEYLLSA